MIAHLTQKAFNRYKSISSKLIIRKKPRGWFSTRPGPRPDTRRYGNDAKPSYRTTGRTSQSPKFEKTWEAPLLGKCSWSAFDVVNSVLAVRSACLKRIQFLKSGPIVEVNVYPDVEPLVYRLRPLAWRFALSFQSYGFLSPSSCWTDPLYLSFLSECFSKPSFFQNLLRSSFFLRCLRNRPQPLKYVVRGVAYSIQAISLRGLWNERKAGTKRDFNGDFPVVPAMRLLCCLTRKRERSSGLN
ncbi:hypothetical protein L1987_88195 [Smallanthus sonchifolius]|nr:hypothetical protein L1987_88195 [Smallanthus sonchifolius]